MLSVWTQISGLSEMSCIYDVRLETTQRNNEDCLHWGPDQFSGSGPHDLNRDDRHRRYMGTSHAHCACDRMMNTGGACTERKNLIYTRRQ